MLSVIITAHNEGDEVRRTIESVKKQSQVETEILVVDDGSTDGCCDELAGERLRVIRHDERVGVACSRDEAAHDARGDVLVFLDGHQRVSLGCLDRCAETARRHQAIVAPDIRTLHYRSQLAHGATFRLCDRNGFFTAAWNARPPRQMLSRVTSLRAPAYVVPSNVYRRIRWIPELRGWGGSEAAISLKAFFLDVPILHLCGPLARHRFKKSFQYDVSMDEVWRNQALIARVCFDERSWCEHWLPTVFQGHLTETMRHELASAFVQEQQQEFQRQKRRTDREFWHRLLHSLPPRSLRRTTVGWRCPEFHLPLNGG